jgi:Flp pilus assembly protein TadG
MLKELRQRAENGQDMVEFALILPLLLLLLIGIMEFGVMIMRYDTVANAAREGARYGIIHHDLAAGDGDRITDAVLNLTTGLDPADFEEIAVTEPAADTIRVEVTYDHRWMTGLLVSWVGLDPVIPLHTVATMHIE